MSNSATKTPAPARQLPIRRRIAILGFLTFTAFVLSNMLIAAVYAIQHMISPFQNAIEVDYRVVLEKYYPGWRRAAINRLIAETYEPMQYSAFVEFQETPRQGTFVNVHKAGFRVSADQAPWPPTSNRPIIFVFGGSTTFGYGVRDDDTIASALSRRLRRESRFKDAQIYNFGRGFYWSSQERALFESLRAAGLRPDLAIFIDGLNEFSHPIDALQFSSTLTSAFQRELARTSSAYSKFVAGALNIRDLLMDLPMVQLARDIRHNVLLPSNVQVIDPETIPQTEERLAVYLRNKALIEASASVDHIDTLFVWQPVPTFKYPQSLHRDFVAQRGFTVHSQSYYGYARMEKGQEQMRDARFLWCADIQKNAKAPLYVDLVHYNPTGTEQLASCIVSGLHNRVEKPAL